MRKSVRAIRNFHKESHGGVGALFREFILGGQDGLVNVLGVILGVAVATSDAKLVLIAGLAATFAESFSMAAVAYTSAKAEEDYYYSQQKKELWEIDHAPDVERKEIYDIYYKKGFRGKLLNDIVGRISSNKKMWLGIMMKEELGLSDEFIHPVKSAFVVGLAALVGSFIPLTAFFFLPVGVAVVWSIIVSAISLFITGVIEARFNLVKWWKKGLEMMIIGMAAAGIGFLIGKLLGVSV